MTPEQRQYDLKKVWSYILYIWSKHTDHMINGIIDWYDKMNQSKYNLRGRINWYEKQDWMILKVWYSFLLYYGGTSMIQVNSTKFSVCRPWIFPESPDYNSWSIFHCYKFMIYTTWKMRYFSCLLRGIYISLLYSR